MDQAQKKLPRSKKLAERCAILADVIQSIVPIYVSATTENQRQLIETMIGAAIWYLPQSGELWTGMISVEAIRGFHPELGVEKPKLTADHNFPRKVAAKELLHLTWNDYSNASAELLRRYTESYGRFNWITSTENRKLMKFQRTNIFASTTKSYELAGVALLSITREQLADIRARNKNAVELILANANP